MYMNSAMQSQYMCIYIVYTYPVTPLWSCVKGSAATYGWLWFTPCTALFTPIMMLYKWNIHEFGVKYLSNEQVKRIQWHVHTVRYLQVIADFHSVINLAVVSIVPFYQKIAIICFSIKKTYSISPIKFCYHVFQCSVPFTCWRVSEDVPFCWMVASTDNVN